MLRLRTFGGLAIERTDGPAPSVGAASARRRLAVLAVLAASGARGIRRDKLLLLFWPDSDNDRARHALVQAMFALRRDLGSDELVLGREELRLNPDVLTSDLGEFREALGRGDRARAVELYSGPFLDGVYLAGADEFERWAEQERAQLSREVETALQELAVEASDSGDHQAAAQWWQRIAVREPRKTHVVVALMTALAATGDRAAALRQARVYEDLTSSDAGLEPNPVVAALAERLRREPPVGQQQGTHSGEVDAPPLNGIEHASVYAERDASEGDEAPYAHQAAPVLPIPGVIFADRYVVERAIARGGTATVFLARDERNERPVALKIPHPELTAGIGVERFQREITVTANLQHPHILPIYESGETNGTLYFVMPFVEGESLRHRLEREGQLPVDDALRLATEIADALAYAHQRDIVHRDIKPENVLLTSGHAVVIDFGLARALDDANARHTLPGVVIGTPAYLSPEQATGDRGADAKSDQYCLAYLLYEMLAGEPPFPGPGIYELIVQRLSDVAPPLRTRRAEVPEHVERALQRALALNPAERFDSVTSFAQALRSPNGATPSWQTTASLHRALHWLGRHTSHPRIAAGAAAAVLLLLAASTAWTLTSRQRVPFARRGWILPADFENRTRDSVFDRSLDAALTAGLQQSAYANVFPRARVQQTLARMGRAASDTHLDETVAREIAEREGLRAVVAGSIDQVDSSYTLTIRLVDPATGVALTSVSGGAKRKGDVIAALGDLVRQLRRDIGESSSALAKHDLPLPLATTRSLEALRTYAQANQAWNAGSHDAAFVLWREAIALDSNFALARTSLGAAYYWNNDRPNGDVHFQRALSQLDRLTDRERLLVRARIEGWRGNREAAITLRRALLAEYPDDQYAWGQMAYDYLRLGRYEESIEAYRRQIALDSTGAIDYINLATAYKGLGTFDEALRYYGRAFALQPNLRTMDNLNHEYGSTLVLAGRIDEAAAAFQLMLSGNADQQARGHRSMALLHMLQGRYGSAADEFRAAALLSSSRRQPVSEARNRLFLATAEQEKGRHDVARRELQTVYSLFRSAYLEPTLLLYYGKALVADGQLARASEVLDTLSRRVLPANPKDRSAQLVLTGEIVLAQGRADSAVSLFQLAHTIDSSAYISESLARGLAASGNLAAAAQRYAALAGARKSWFGGEAEQFGLQAPRDAGRVYEQMKDTARARVSYEQVLAQWAGGDTDLVTIRQSQDRLATLLRASTHLTPRTEEVVRPAGAPRRAPK